METKTPTRTQKAKARTIQKQLLQTIADYNRNIERYGEPYAHLKTVEEMFRLHLITESELDNLLNILYMMEVLRIARDKAKVFSEINNNQEIDTSQLYIGMVVKNFRELCSLVGLNAANGERQRKQQRNKLRRYIDFEELAFSNEIMILEIYDEPLKSGQKYSGKFINEMKIIILYYLMNTAAKHSDEIDDDGFLQVESTYNSLIKRNLKLINPLFAENGLLNDFFNEKYPEYFTDTNVKYNLINLYNRLYNKVKGAINTALNRLDAEEMISLEEYYIVKKDNADNSWEWLPITSQKEKTYIKNARKEAAEKLGYKTSWECLYHGKKTEFENILFEKVFEEKGWSAIRYRINIGFNILHIQKYLHEYLDIGECRAVFFANMADALNSQAVKQCEKESSEYLSNREKYINALQTQGIDVLSRQEIEEDYDNKFFYKRKYKDSFPKSQELITSYIVNPNEQQQTELDEYKKQWFKNHSEKKSNIVYDVFDGEEDLPF